MFLAQNHLALLKDRFLKEMLLKKEQKPVAFFLAKTTGSNIKLKTISGFQDSLVWNQWNSYTMAYRQNASSCDPLNAIIK